MLFQNFHLVFTQLPQQKLKINNYRKYIKKIYGVQFHPEVTHTENGKKIFKNFIFLFVKLKNWFIKSEKKD